MASTRAESGRKGGLTTLERYGRDQLAEWGQLGGRPGRSKEAKRPSNKQSSKKLK